MEEIIVLLIQFLLEVVLQLFGSIGFDLATSRNSEREQAGCGTLTWFGLFGAICGGLSLIFAPKPLLPNASLRIANLFVAPFIAGGMSYLFTRILGLDRGSDPTHHFWRGFWFALCFGVIRFAYIHR